MADRVLDALNGAVDRAFTAYAKAISRFGAIVFVVGAGLAIAFSLGLLVSETEKDADALWVDVDSRLVEEKRQFERYFGGLTRKLSSITTLANKSAIYTTATAK